MTQNAAKTPGNQQVRLETTRLLLRAAVDDDAPYLYDAFRDPEAMRYWNEPPHANITRTESWLASMTKSPQNGVTDFIICLKPSLQPIGKMGVWSGDEIGFILNRSQWRKGIAMEALGVVLPHLFETMRFDSISADVDPRNEGSLCVLEKVGFERERFERNTFRIGEDWVDSVYLRLTKERWKATGS